MINQSIELSVLCLSIVFCSASAQSTSKSDVPKLKVAQLKGVVKDWFTERLANPGFDSSEFCVGHLKNITQKWKNKERQTETARFDSPPTNEEIASIYLYTVGYGACLIATDTVMLPYNVLADFKK